MQNSSYFYFTPFLLCLFFLVSTQITAQTNDNIIWASFKLQQNVDEKTSIAIAPILRLNDNISDYQNWSVDYSIKRKLGSSWAIQLLGRTWFMPNATNRQFLWFDIAYGKKLGNFKLGSFVRWHYALDIKDRIDNDFIRWHTSLALTNLGKISPFVAIEPWFRLNKESEFQNIRYKVGFNYKLSDPMSLKMVWWRQETMNLEPSTNFNIYVISLSYLLPNKKKS